MTDDELRRQFNNLSNEIRRCENEASDKGHALIIFWLFITMAASCGAERKLDDVKQNIRGIELDVSIIRSQVSGINR